MPSRQPRFLCDDDYEDVALFDLLSWDLPGLSHKQTLNHRQLCQDRRLQSR